LNYSEDESVTPHSKEKSGEEEADDEVEDTVDNGEEIYRPRSQGKENCQITILPLRICCVPTDRANQNVM